MKGIQNGKTEFSFMQWRIKKFIFSCNGKKEGHEVVIYYLDNTSLPLPEREMAIATTYDIGELYCAPVKVYVL